MLRIITWFALSYSIAVAQNQITCRNVTVPVSVSARNGVFPGNIVSNTSVGITDFILNLTRQGSNFTESILQGYETMSGTYNITGTYCAPAQKAPCVVQILTHGVGFDRSYWNLPFNEFNYSYSNEAVGTYGFATFAYDRLGIGESGPKDPLNIVQSYTEMSALKTLTQMLRNGNIDGLPAFTKVLHVGHSYGSIQTVGLLHMNPDLWDGVALTGYSTQQLYFNFFELGAGFRPASEIESTVAPGYLAPGGLFGIQQSLLAPNVFDPAILPFLAATGSPATVGEFLTLTAGSAALGPSTNFTGPALVITGERDLPFCGGNCLQQRGDYTSLPEAAKALFPQSSCFETVIVPDTGHGLNLQYTFPLTYRTVNEFFIQNGLGP